MDGYIERQTLQDIADAIREKNGSEETYKPSEMAEAIRGIEGGREGFDYTAYGLTDEQSEGINAIIAKEDAEVFAYLNTLKSKTNWSRLFLGTYTNKWARKLKAIPYSTSFITNIENAFYQSSLKIIDNFDFSNMTQVQVAFGGCDLYKLPTYFNLKKCTVAYELFNGASLLLHRYDEIVFDFGSTDENPATCSFYSALYNMTVSNVYVENFRIIGNRVNSIYNIFFNTPIYGENFYFLQSENITSLQRLQGAFKNYFIGSIEKVTSFVEMVKYNTAEIYEFTNWKQGNIPFGICSKLLPSSIHYIIQNAMSVADGATARTLTLHATAKTNWQNSEYYEQDLAVLTDKGITIA